MPWITVTDRTYQMVAAKALLPFVQAGSRHLDSGDWEVQLDQEVYDKIEELRQEGETPDDVITKILERSDH